MAPEIPTLAQWLVRALEAAGIDTAFGIPGVHTVELYRGLAGSALRHVTPRHEQGAGFMADGYARATGRPAACFVITGPGLTNTITAMAQAHADSVPMLVISSVNRRCELGMRQGRLHELAAQQRIAEVVTAFSHTLLSADNLPRVLSEAFAVFTSQRPRPVHIEIPRDLLAAPATAPVPERWPTARYRPTASVDGVARAVALLDSAERPVVLFGGGAIGDPAAARALVERLDAPTLTTINARGLLGNDHPLDLSTTASFAPIRRYLANADVVLAVGTELAETDYDMVFDNGFELGGALIRIDLDANQISRFKTPAVGLIGDAGAALRAIGAGIGVARRNGAATVARLRQALDLERRPDIAPFLPLFHALESVLPEAIVVGDSTRPVYAGNFVARRAQPRRWFNAATGFGTLGYALPAAIGARLGRPDLAVVALVGDGGLMFTLSELASARDAGCPIIVILWHNAGYEEIRQYMQDAHVSPCGVDPTAPDFAAIARAFDCSWARVRHPAALAPALVEASTSPTLSIIEIDALSWLADAVPA